MIFNKIINIGFRSNFTHLAARTFTSLQNFITQTALVPYNNGLPIMPSQTFIQKSQILQPVSFLINQVAGFKVKGRLKRRCKDCFFVMRQQRLHVLCKTHPRHKQMAMKAKDKKSWILTHATQSHIRPY
ncbi:uncharacterized protein LOC129612852 [Condylostylus longicornis]|uniref:uncharacterized protein LOC129612852 n=1 Tax=Condylostylus longicornis TaxID=2530218 RepID=UPI00244DA0F8|nr:uncharacterized protein LOC129612852 [Condylostylus longicornis]